LNETVRVVSTDLLYYIGTYIVRELFRQVLEHLVVLYETGSIFKFFLTAAAGNEAFEYYLLQVRFAWSVGLLLVQY